jgi:hypothetical protein
MADQSVIREFLVSLGYTVDGNSEKKFNSSLKGAVVQANLLAEAITSMARVVVEGVQKVAQSFDGLYWASQRTGASVQNIRALSYAVSQLGGTYEGARGAIEAFGQHLRSNPGYTSLLHNLGVKTSENGKMRDQVEILEDLGKVLGKQKYPVALQYANALGIDENTMRALMSGDLQKNIGEYDNLQKQLGFNNQKAADAAKDFMQSMREAQMTIETVVAKILTDLEPQLSKVMKEFADWVATHGPQIEQAIVEIGGVVELLGKDFATLVEDLKPAWQEFDHLTQSLVGKDGLVAAIELLVGGAVLGKLIRMLATLTGGGGSGGGMLMPFIAAIGGLLSDGARFSPAELNTPEALKKLNDHSGAWYSGLWGKTKSALGFGGSPERGAPTTSAGQNASALESYKFWRSKGLSHNGALGMVGNEEGESGFDPHNVGDGGQAGGSFQWHKERRDQILAGTGIDVWSKNTSHSDMLRAAHWEMTAGPDQGARKAWDALNNSPTPAVAAAAGVKYYERPLDQQGDAYKRGIMANRWASRIPENTDFSVSPANNPANNNSQTVSQTTNINVVGATDPSATASAIANKQTVVNTTMQRNLQGAVR